MTGTQATSTIAAIQRERSLGTTLAEGSCPSSWPSRVARSASEASRSASVIVRAA